MLSQLVRGPLLIPRAGGAVDFHHDGVLAADDRGTLVYAGSWSGLRCQLGDDRPPVRQSAGVMLPPLLDVHTHISQHPIRGRFGEGVPDDAPGGKLLNSLQRNVFPAEAKCHDAAVAESVVRAFQADTLRHGVVGGAAFMTASAVATEVALSILPQSWSVGLVLMNQNCPPSLCTDEANATADIKRLAERFGRRFIVTDRFAVAVTSPLRRQASALAGRFGLRTQTHLNEQIGEKAFVETTLYPNAANYTDVYLKDGLLDHQCILAHCIQMRPEEWQIVKETGSAVAHCPTSNLLLGSGLMALDDVVELQVPYALGTDVGASPTVSMLAEMNRFLAVHQGRSARATPSEALYRSTRASADILGLAASFGSLEAGWPMSFIEVETDSPPVHGWRTDDVIRAILPVNLDEPKLTVRRVTIEGKEVSAT